MELKGRFVSREEFASQVPFGGNEKDGVFVTDPTSRTSSDLGPPRPASCASLKGFLCLTARKTAATS